MNLARKLVWLVGALAAPACEQGPTVPPPIIDMHLHAQHADSGGQPLCLPVTTYGVENPVCDDPVPAPKTDDELVRATVETMRRRNVYGVISGDTLELVRRFQNAAPDRLTPAYVLDLGNEDALSVDQLRHHVEAGDFAVLGEIENQYSGIDPGDPRMDPYWALAEELQIPVALHLGEAYPGAAHTGSPRSRVSQGNPLLLEDVLVRYPRLRLYVMHFGSPFVDEMIAILYAYPNVYIGIGGNTWPYGRDYFYSQLEQFMNAGFGKRILFGSDQMKWPDLIGISIDVIEDAPFLTEQEKRDILYHNAVRFLALSSGQTANHHGN